MHEKIKLTEAKYFYNRMIEERDNIKHFKYNLSAFLSSARSILQYALKESKTKQGGQTWFDNCIAANPIFSFFKDKRDVNIHLKPASPKTQHNLEISEAIHLSDSIDIELRDKDGNVIDEYHSLDGPKTSSHRKDSSKVVSYTTYRFGDWNDNEDVVALCQKYLQELENFVNEGIAQSFISG